MNYSIIVMSCDKYADLWEAFVQCFKKYWPDCDSPVYLVTESLSYDGSFFKETVKCGIDTQWTDRLDMCLDIIDTDYILLLCDDYLLCDKVDNTMVNSLVELAKKFNAGNLRMLPNPDTAVMFSEKFGLGEYKEHTHYRIATQAGIWKTE